MFVGKRHMLQHREKPLLALQAVNKVRHGMDAGQGMQRPTMVTGGRSADRVTARAEAVSMVCVGTPARSFANAPSTIALGSVSSINCTRGSMSSA